MQTLRRKVARVVGLVALTGCNFSQDFRLPVQHDAGSSEDGAASCGSPADANNCGVCGHSCLGGACEEGKCLPIMLASGQGDSVYGASWFPYSGEDARPLEGPDRIAVDDTHAYWLNLAGAVMRVPVSGGETERVAITKPRPAWIELDAEHVYFSTLEGEIFRVAKGGGTPVLLAPAANPRAGVVLLPGSPYPVELHVSSGELTWADGSGVYSCPVAGCSGAPETIAAGTPDNHPFSFATDANGKMYACEEGPSFEFVNYAMTVLREGQWLGVAGPTAYYELHGGTNEVYAFATTDFGPVGVVRWSESSITFLASGDAVPEAPRGLALDDGFVYWPNAAKDDSDRRERTASVVRCKKTGCALPEVLADGQVVPRAVAVANDAVYWTTGDGKVMKVATPEATTPGAL